MKYGRPKAEAEAKELWRMAAKNNDIADRSEISRVFNIKRNSVSSLLARIASYGLELPTVHPPARNREENRSRPKDIPEYIVREIIEDPFELKVYGKVRYTLNGKPSDIEHGNRWVAMLR